MDSIQYILLFVIVVIGIGGCIAFYLQYNNPNYDIDKIISNDKKLFEMMQVRYELKNFENTKNAQERFKNLMAMREINEYEIFQTRSADNHMFSIMMMKMTLEERKQKLINESQNMNYNHYLDNKKEENSYNLQMAQIESVKAIQREIDQLTLEGKRIKLEGKKAKVEGIKYEIDGRKYDVDGKRYDVQSKAYNSMFENERYSQERQRSIRESELHNLRKGIEALTMKSEFLSRYGEIFKDEKEKRKLDEYLKEMKGETDNIFKHLNTLEI